MKKYLFLLVGIIAFAFTSCSKDTTYQVSNKSDFNLFEVIGFEYYGNDRVNQDNIGNVGMGATSETIIAEKQAEKVKFGFRFASDGDWYYTSQYYLLEAKGNKVFTIDNNTMVSTNPNAKEAMQLGKLLK